MTSDAAELDDYVDVRAMHPEYFLDECWYCGHSEYRKEPVKACPACFIGQHDPVGEDYDPANLTPEGYIDYRLRWYGDVSLAEAKRRYEEETKERREELQRQRARERAIRVTPPGE